MIRATRERRRSHFLRTVACFWLGLFPTSPALGTPGPSHDIETAWRWAPIVHQIVDSSGDHSSHGRADFWAAVDYDGDWNPMNNWENLDDYALIPTLYYSLVETESHLYALYMIFHPRDWTDRSISPRWVDSEHENDAEAFLAVINKTHPARLEAGFTIFHDRLLFYPHVRAYSVGLSPDRFGNSRSEPTLFTSLHDRVARPVLVQETQGHGLRAWPELPATGERVVYYPATVGEEPENTTDTYVPYGLVDIFEPGGLWERRNDSTLFPKPARFGGDCEGGAGQGLRSCEENKASPPWGMQGRGNSVGEIAIDPAGLYRRTLREVRAGTEDVELEYMRNGYTSH